ncbi:MAG: hypothetical protein HW380_3859 [Magnetococcales bacterium]|nr:hypothetical protein [Magnetococcales bacterium]HIJ84615.1 hypothetical protein [Magnetococcales bacterium]
MFSTGGLRIDQAPPLSLPFRFFVTAPFFLLLTALSLLFYGPDLFVTPLAPETIATVHLVVLGWVCMIMFGAMYQMIPVLAGIPVPWPRWVPWVHGLLVTGVVAMVFGLTTGFHPWVLSLASLSLGGAVFLFIVPVLTALIWAPSRHPTVIAMRIATVSLLGVLLLGSGFLLEYAFGFLDLDRSALVTTHLIWGLWGWVGLLIAGVSFQVLPMFYMTRDISRRQSLLILSAWSLFLVGQPLALFFAHSNPWIFWLPVAFFSLALLGYTANIGSMLWERKRKKMDVTLRFWFLGLASGLASLATMASWMATDADSTRFLFGVLFFFGLASSILLGMLYKIIPFLVWFHRFSRLAGLVEIPMMDDLVPDFSLRWQFPVHFLVVATAIVAVFWGGWPPVTQLLAFFLAADAALVLYTLWFALGHQPPQQESIPDFASFFKDTAWMAEPKDP